MLTDNENHLKEQANMTHIQSFNDTQWNRGYLYHGDQTVIIFVIILITVMVLAIGGNILVLATLSRHRGMRTRTNLLLANLATADIIMAVTDIPFAINTLIHGTWTLSHHLCILNAFAVGVGMMVSIHTLMWISVHKFISITRPFSKIITQNKIILMMIMSWGWCIFYNLTPLPVIGWTDIIYRRGASQCGPTTPISLLQRSHSMTNTIFNMVLPFTVMTYCYYHIFGEVRSHMNRLRDFSDVDVQNSAVQQKRVTMTLFIVLACFVLCWTPYIFYSNLIVFRGNKAVPEILNPMAYLFGYMNSACNPIIYALRSPSFRKGFGEIICGSEQMHARKFSLSLSGITLIKRKQSTMHNQNGVGTMYAANKCKGAGLNYNMKNGQNFSPQSLMGNREIIKSTSLPDIANNPSDSKPFIIKSSSILSVYDNYPMSMNELYITNTEKSIIKDTNKTVNNKENEVMVTSSILCNIKSSHSDNYQKGMSRSRGSLPEVFAEPHNKQIKTLKNKSEQNLAIDGINKHFPYKNIFLHYASVGDLPNKKYSIEFMETEISLPSIPTAFKWQASIEDLIESSSQIPTVL